MVVIGRVRSPQVSHFDGAISKWGMTSKCRSRRVSSQLASVPISAFERLPEGHEPADSNRPRACPQRVSATISTPAETCMATAVRSQRRLAISVAPRRAEALQF